MVYGCFEGCFEGTKACGKILRRDYLLISAHELKDLMAGSQPPLVLSVANPAQISADGIIPGALNVWRPDYQQPVDKLQPLDGLIPTREQFADFCKKVGVMTSREVVIYDHLFDATRLWWVFHVFGKRTRVLDGGMRAWKEAAFPVECGVDARSWESNPRGGDWTPPEPSRSLLSLLPEVIALASATGCKCKSTLWDVREVSEWDGSEIKLGAFRGGRIPHAKARVDWNMFRERDSEGKPLGWKSPVEIKAVAQAVGFSKSSKNIFYCQSGVRTTQLIFGLLLGGWPLSSLSNYDGSWIEWSYHQDLPMLCN